MPQAPRTTTKKQCLAPRSSSTLTFHAQDSDNDSNVDHADHHIDPSPSSHSFRNEDSDDDDDDDDDGDDDDSFVLNGSKNTAVHNDLKRNTTTNSFVSESSEARRQTSTRTAAQPTHTTTTNCTTTGTRRLFFAVRKGKHVENAIFFQWKDCQNHVEITDDHITYSAFYDWEDAIQYLEDGVAAGTSSSSVVYNNDSDNDNDTTSLNTTSPPPVARKRKRGRPPKDPSLARAVKKKSNRGMRSSTWEDTLRVLETFKEEHGHGNISSKDPNKRYANVAKKLRRLKADKVKQEPGNTLTDEREQEIMTKFGFDFTLEDEDIQKPYYYTFEERFEQFERYMKEQGGDGNFPGHLRNTTGLGHYLKYLRQSYSIHQRNKRQQQEDKQENADDEEDTNPLNGSHDISTTTELAATASNSKKKKRTNTTLTDEQFAKIEALGIRLAPVKSNLVEPEPYKVPKTWEETWQLMERLQKEKGTANILSTSPKNELGYFAKRLRKMKVDKDNNESGHTMTDEHEQRLRSYGFDFTLNEEDSKRVYHYSFDERMEQCRRFIQDHGSLSKLPSQTSLGRYLMRLREPYNNYLQGKKSLLTEQRVEEVTAMGFSLIPTIIFENKAPKRTWEERYRELVQYKKQHGHVNIKKRDGPLGQWVRAQRSDYRLLKEGKPSKMSVDRFVKLSEIDFIWKVKPD